MEISVGHDDPGEAHAAIGAAFAAVERVHRLMSFHDPESEISRLNRWAASGEVAVSGETFRVLQCALELHERTRGIFDIAVAPELMENRTLPRHTFLGGRTDYCGRTADIRFLPGGTVRFSRPLCIDLGGIAKGFAVDEAVGRLRACGMDSGFVNAGGDMACFGEPRPVWVRHPRNPGEFLPLPALENGALATSANAYLWREQPCAHIHGQTREPLRRPFSVSVRAGSCLMADALTKVVLALEEESETVLPQFQATALAVYPDGRVVRYGGDSDEA